MKAVFLFIVFGIFSLCLPAQTEIKKGIKQDTIVKTRTFLQNTQVTPAKVAVRFKDTTPPDNYWKFNIAYGMAFGEQTTFNFIPQVSYSRNVFFSIGGGLNYIYYHLSRKDRKEQTHYAGLNAFAPYYPPSLSDISGTTRNTGTLGQTKRSESIRPLCTGILSRRRFLSPDRSGKYQPFVYV